MEGPWKMFIGDPLEVQVNRSKIISIIFCSSLRIRYLLDWFPSPMGLVDIRNLIDRNM